MKTRLILAIALTVLVFLLAIVAAPTVRYELPFAWHRQGNGSFVVAARRDMPLPTGWQTGDILDLHRLDFTGRALLWVRDVLPSRTYALTVLREGHPVTVRVHTVAVPLPRVSLSFRFLEFATGLLTLTLGLLVLWRGTNWAAWGLGFFAFSVLIGNQLILVPAPPLGRAAIDLLKEILTGPAALSALIVTAFALVGQDLKRQVSRWLVAFAMAASGLNLLGLIAGMVGFVGFSDSRLSDLMAKGWIGASIFISLVILPVLVLLLGYYHTGPEQRLRIRWILWSTALILPVVAISMATSAHWVSGRYTVQVASEATLLLITIMFAGYTYAVLRQRLVDVRIVINRTLVYGAITAIVVGIFATISTLVERAALGRGAGLLLELIVPLALGIVLSTLRKQIDGYINRFLFRRQYRAETALNNFARTCGFIQQPSRLLDLAAEQVFRHSGVQSVAVYECDSDGYTRVRQSGTGEFPERVEADDLVFVGLRAGDHEADLHTVESALGPDGYVFSMAVRGKLIGALVCGPRPAEQYTAEERELLQHVAHEVGAALAALRAREGERLLEALAEGTLDPVTARAQAQQLFASRAAAL